MPFIAGFRLWIRIKIWRFSFCPFLNLLRAEDGKEWVNSQTAKVGLKEKRIGFDSIMKLARQRKLEAIVVTSLDRWGGSLQDEIFVVGCFSKLVTFLEPLQFLLH